MERDVISVGREKKGRREEERRVRIPRAQFRMERCYRVLHLEEEAADIKCCAGMPF